tara:strand:+ start:192 stop:1946 length:1755 start_codon:yes stop_codon:yes gene_type:complete
LNKKKKVRSGLSKMMLQVMWTRLIAVVEGQAKSLVRTAFSATVSEAGDLSAAVFDTEGRMIAQAVTGTPGHVNSLAEAVKNFVLEVAPSRLRDGDHLLTNDPWLSSGHLHDITVVTPTFREGSLVGFFACCCHQVDIGGLGQGPDAKSVFEEGLYIPIMYLAKGGELNDDLIKIIKANVRQPYEVEGDILSYITSNETGGRLLNQMLDEFPNISFKKLADYIIDFSQKSMEEKIKHLPIGVYRNSMKVDGYDKEVFLKARLEVKQKKITIDFEGSSEASKFGINLVYNYTLAYSAYGVRAALAPEIPNNTGSLAPIEVLAPKDSILNVRKPAPVCARHIIGQFLPDLVLGCLQRVVPEGIQAEGSAGIWGIQARGGRELSDIEVASALPTFDLLFFNSGGTGARPTSDGLSATGFPSGVQSLPTEAVENFAPVIIWRKEFRPSSGGAGKWRGGLGQSVEFSVVDDSSFAVFAMFDRVVNPARGRKGGFDGICGRVVTSNGKKLKAKGKQVVQSGDRLVIDVPGGAGYGKPIHRNPIYVLEDFKLGLIDAKTAKLVYGVAFTSGGAIDYERTKLLRKKLKISKAK